MEGFYLLKNVVRSCYGIFKKQCKYSSYFGWERWGGAILHNKLMVSVWLVFSHTEP